jgi:transmembrane sensor
VKAHAPATVLTSLMWRKGMVSFHETSLADAAAEFNRYNRIKIVIHDPRARHETINGTLPINDLGEFTHMAANLFGLHARRQGNQIVLFR